MTIQKRYLLTLNNITQRYRISNKNIRLHYEKTGKKKNNRIIYQRKGRPKPLPPSHLPSIPPAKKIYRSQIVFNEYNEITIRSIHHQSLKQEIELRIWIHTSKPDIQESDLQEAAKLAIQHFNVNSAIFTESSDKMELNREIDEDEMQPDKKTDEDEMQPDKGIDEDEMQPDKGIDEWYAFLQFIFDDGREYEYYAKMKRNASEFSTSPPFRS